MDREEFVRRVHALEQQMYRICCGQLRDEQDRRDAVQETILRAWQGVRRLRNTDYFETWLIRILINECHNIQRAHRRLVPVAEMPEQEYVDGSEPELREAVLDLSEKLRLPVMLHYIEGYSTEEISRILHIPLGTVRSRLKRAREALKSELTDP